MDMYFVLDCFKSDWEKELRKFERNLKSYDKETFEDDFYSYACELARMAKAKILEWYNDDFKMAYDLKLLEDTKNIEYLHHSLIVAFNIIDREMHYAKDYNKCIDFICEQNSKYEY